MVLQLISRSPWRPGFLATIAPRTNALAFAREKRLLLKGLDASVGASGSVSATE
jgi:hypothetical protein